GESLKRLFPSGESMAGELQQAVALAQQGGTAPSAPLAMEVATSLLYIEASLEDADFDHPELGARVRRLADRIAAVRQGMTPAPLEGWMEDLYRRVSDRQTMGSVVQELRASLSEAEKLIDQFFRNPADRSVLIEVPNQLSSMRGVLSVLGMEQAAAALLRMRDEVDGLASTEVDPARVDQAGVFDRLAGNLGALGFLIDMLSVQPQLAKSLFFYDAQEGTLSPLMGRRAQRAASGSSVAAPVEPRLIEQAQMLAFSAVREDVSTEDVSRDLELLAHEAEAADQQALVAAFAQAQAAIDSAHDQAGVATARGELSDLLVDFVNTASEAATLEPAPAPRPAPPAAPATAAGSDLAEDDEMREIFLEEAREVLQTAHDACTELATASDDLEQLTTVRRAFHTLKGSSRMVGLKKFGDAAWACEQLYNTRLADQQPADEPLLTFTRWSLDELSHWVDDIAARRDAGREPAAIEAAALALREPGSAPAATPTPAAAPAPAVRPPEASKPAPAAPHAVEPIALAFPPDLPDALDLELKPAPKAAAASTEPPLPSFELDLSKLDAAFSAPAATASSEAPADLGVSSMFDNFDAGATTVVLDGRSAAAPQQPVAAPEVELIDLDLGDASFHAAPVIENLQPTPAAAPAEDEQVKIVGPLRISIPLFNIFLNEADELSRRLTTEVAEWAMELHRPVGETAIALAHSLAGSSATVGFSELSQLSRALEHALTRTEAIGHGTA
ncbi:MAG TPA: Hpt domain-containing protein, partial [Albitalea sp.]|nr:Hpt domain-containing protein [Albitalea sp.]